MTRGRSPDGGMERAKPAPWAAGFAGVFPAPLAAGGLPLIDSCEVDCDLFLDTASACSRASLLAFSFLIASSFFCHCFFCFS